MTEKTGLMQSSLNGAGINDHDSERKHQSTGSDQVSIRSYFTGYVICFVSVIMTALNFAATQLLDGIADVIQLSFGQFSCTLLMIICDMLYQKRGPKFLYTNNIIYIIVAIFSTLACVAFGFLASTYVPVGTLNAIIVLNFVAVTLLILLIKNIYYKTGFQCIVIILDTTTVILLWVGVIFIVQPQEMFGVTGYFNNKNVIYTSLCNRDRFKMNGSSNDTSKNLTKMYLSYSWQGYLFAVLAGVTMSVGLLAWKKMLEQEDVKDILFWVPLSCSTILLILTCFEKGFIFPHNTLCFVLLLVQSFTGALGYYLYHISLTYIASIDVAIIQSFILPMLFVFQFTFLSSVSPTQTNAVAIVASVIIVVLALGKPLLQGILLHKGYIEYNANE